MPDMSDSLEGFTARELLVYARGVNAGAEAMMRANVRTISRLASAPDIAGKSAAVALGLVAQALEELADEGTTQVALQIAPQVVAP